MTRAQLSEIRARYVAGKSVVPSESDAWKYYVYYFEDVPALLRALQDAKIRNIPRAVKPSHLEGTAFCPKCESLIHEAKLSKFCKWCGQRLNWGNEL